MMSRVAAMTRCRYSVRRLHPQLHFLNNHTIKPLQSQPKVFDLGKVPGSGMHWLYYLNKRYDSIPIPRAAAAAAEEKDIDMGFEESFAVPIVLYALLDPLVERLT